MRLITYGICMEGRNEVETQSYGEEPRGSAPQSRYPGIQVTLQVHVAVVMAIVKLSGRIDMGHSKVKVTGSGIEAMVKNQMNPEDDDTNSVQNGV